jgi:exodeoxyribonuclease VII small subunit
MAEEKFEEMLEKLEKIVHRMEEGNITLEESIAAFEEGVRLSRSCAKKLDEAQRKVELLLQQNGELKTAPFAGEDTGQTQTDDIPF